MAKDNKIKTLVGTAILAAIVVILQTFASAIHIGPFSITLALVPIIIGAVVLGPLSGAVLGAAFGAVVTWAVITGADVGGYLMFQQNPAATVIVCMLKSTVAGFLAGVISKVCSSKGKLTLGTVLAAIVCPVCNTGILSIAMITIFKELVMGWAQGAGHASLIGYIIIGVVGINFLVELLINLSQFVKYVFQVILHITYYQVCMLLLVGFSIWLLEKEKKFHSVIEYSHLFSV